MNTVSKVRTESHFTWLRKNDACCSGYEAVAKAGNLVDFWRTTERGDWMLWLNCRLGILTPEERKTLAYKFAGFALDAVEPLRPKLKDERSVKALDVARAFLSGAASREELVSARDAARAAWRDSWNAAAAYAAAAYADAAAYAAYAADAAAYADAAYAADAARRQQAEAIREVVSPERFAEIVAQKIEGEAK